MTDSNAAARTSRLTKVYHRGTARHTALDNVDITFERGEFAALMGPSGSGKSTLVHCLTGLEKPTEGRVWIGDVRLTGLSDADAATLRRDRIGLLVRSYNLLLVLTVAENIMLPVELAGRPADPEHVDRVVDSVGLRDELMHMPESLDPGQRQRVAAARALILKPEVVFADEPTADLDARAAKEVVAFLRNSVDALDQTVVMATHDPAVAAHADRVVFFEQGRVATELRAPTAGDVRDRLAMLRRRALLRDTGAL